MSEPHRFLVGGRWRTGDHLHTVRSPYDASPVADVFLAGEADVEDAIRAAVAGFEDTRRLPLYARSRILHALADAIEEHRDQLVETLVGEAGKTRGSAVVEVARAADTLRLSAEEAGRMPGEILPLDRNEGGAGRTAFVRRVPLGPVVGITPFNFPLNLACHKLGPAIAAGNSFILKPSSQTPLSSLLLGEMVVDAGFPPNAISVVPCMPIHAEELVRDPRIAYLSFTGSPVVGWHLRTIAGRKRVGLELGGNAAVIVHHDAPLPFAVSRIVEGGFGNAGQVCIAVQRVFVHRRIYRKVLDAIVSLAGALVVGDPADPATEVGPMVSVTAADSAMRKIREAVSQGATVATGGTCEGSLVAPTVLAETTPQMAVNRTEMFAPVITVTPYDEINEVFRKVNDSSYGLQAGFFTRDISLVMRAFDEISVGGLVINDIPTFRTDAMPYGGVKESGTGREGPRYAIEEMTEMRMMVINTMTDGT
jgi:acyl-CoA reductase-like NAD-dependent aldehyde dehydrogenase